MGVAREARVRRRGGANLKEGDFPQFSVRVSPLYVFDRFHFDGVLPSGVLPQLTRLMELCLEGNHLTYLPAAIGRLENWVKHTYLDFLLDL